MSIYCTSCGLLCGDGAVFTCEDCAARHTATKVKRLQAKLKKAKQEIESIQASRRRLSKAMSSAFAGDVPVDTEGLLFFEHTVVQRAAMYSRFLAQKKEVER